MKFYELMFILKSDLEQETKDEALNRINDLLATNKFEKLKEEHKGVQKLAYEIEKNTSGDYYLYHLKTENSEAVKGISVNLNIIKGLLRYIFIKKESLNIEKEA